MIFLQQPWVPTKRRPESFEATSHTVTAASANTESIPEVAVTPVVSTITESTSTNTIPDTSER